jgi:thiamine kinase-like enzyme
MNKNKLILVDILRNSKLKLARNLFHHELWIRFLVRKDIVINSIFSLGYSSIYRYYRDQDYEMVVKIISSLDESKLNSSMLKILAKSNMQLENHDEHRRLLQIALEKRIKMTLSDLINLLSISKNNNLSSKYSKGLGGMSNLGIIIHFRDNNPVYLTKIKDMSYQGNKIRTEQFFYEELRSLHPSLITYTPKYIDYLELKKLNVSAITIEYIHGRHATIDDLPLLIEIQNELMSVDVHPLLSNSQIQLKLTPMYFYTSKHFWTFVIERIAYSFDSLITPTTASNISLLQEIFIKSKFYKTFYSKDLYVLQHGDFVTGNIVVDEHANKAVVIDWGQVSIALRGNDLIRFAASHDFSLKQAYEQVIAPICFEHPDHQKQIASGLIMEFILSRTYGSIELVTFKKDIEQAIIYLKELHQIRD